MIQFSFQAAESVQIYWAKQNQNQNANICIRFSEISTCSPLPLNIVWPPKSINHHIFCAMGDIFYEISG